MKFFQPNRILILLFLCCLVGCESSTKDADFVKASNDSNLKKMGSVYQLYASRFGYTGPKSKEELKSFLKTNETIVENLKLIELDRNKIDDYFISENDGKEFQFRWGVWVNPDLERANEPLVFETEGKNGIRLVMLSNRKILEVDNDETYQELLNREVEQQDADSDLETESETETETETQTDAGAEKH